MSTISVATLCFNTNVHFNLSPNKAIKSNLICNTDLVAGSRVNQNRAKANDIKQSVYIFVVNVWNVLPGKLRV